MIWKRKKNQLPPGVSIQLRASPVNALETDVRVVLTEEAAELFGVLEHRVRKDDGELVLNTSYFSNDHWCSTYGSQHSEEQVVEMVTKKVIVLKRRAERLREAQENRPKSWTAAT